VNQAFYDRPVLEVAPDLLGCVVSHGDVAGVIVETEAYHFTEPASHSFVGRTPRTEVMFGGGPGTAYVYRSYGIHALLNAVCEPGSAVLIRALEPIAGEGPMRARRRVARFEDLCNGPGKLTQALGMDLEIHGTSLVDGPVQVGARPSEWEGLSYVVGPRVGITKAADLPWRFCAVGSRCVSRPWPPGLRERGLRTVAAGSANGGR
jgi:DNA-3-methyladenine glycosylase